MICIDVKNLAPFVRGLSLRLILVMGLRNDELIGGNRLSINLSRVMAKTQVVYSLLTNTRSSYVLWKNMLMFLTSLILGYLEVHLA